MTTPSETALSAELAAIGRSLDNIEVMQRLLLRAAKTKPPTVRHPVTPFRERLAAANRRRAARLAATEPAGDERT